MGGYMGFGMASWIYKQRPRKAFSKRKRRPTCNTLSTYKREFKLQPSKNKREIFIGFSVLIVILITFLMYYKIEDFTDHHNNWATQKKELRERSNKSAYRFLMNSGIKRLESNNLVGAHSEFKLAHNLFPNDETVNQLLIETLVGLCDNENEYCVELDDMLTDSL
ncbi:hypothetical protein [Psychroserpens sp. Hel_I_66]|uniref:hypothetical protein n=1 Tax=Psychroserpens sp. Hel_I_66 TaxID=1250004 RepID=UPI0006469E2A|nr:hypothetical protein [Psychroserpens sp. Hel_I_66]